MNKLSLISMASWNPNPTLGGASWAGNPAVATRQQLLSTSSGLYDDLKDFSFSTINASTINVSTLNVADWISAQKIYVSDIQGYRIDLSGVIIDASGVFVANNVSANQSYFNITNVSVQQFVFKPTFTGNIEVSFNLGLGEAIGGFLAGLGAAVGGAFIGLGTALGLAIQGAEQGIATMIAGRPQNFINSNVYETINFTSQLQVSTLGNAYPAYSSIFRTVSSLSADTIPGREIFTSTIFYPGQICIRSASDPINLITGNSNINSSTIQSFGQWVPLDGLEPTNIIANSVSTNFLSTGQAEIDNAQILTLSNYAMTTSNLQVGIAATMNYNAGLVFDLGSSGDAAIVGSINQWNFLTQQPMNFYGELGEPGALTPGAVLTLGTGAQSIFQVSSIAATGNIQANTGYFSSLVVNELTVVSTFSTVYTVVACNVLSTGLVTADLVSTINLQAQAVWPFYFSSILGNPVGKFDINKYDTVISTTYNQVSSLTQNILNYSLNVQVQDEPNFSIGDGPMGVTYYPTPQNVAQWASTQIIFNGYTGVGAIDLGWVGQWAATPGTTPPLPGGATFDVLYTTVPSIGYAADFYLIENSNAANPVNTSTFYSYVDPTGGGNPFTGTWTGRMTLPPVVGGVRSGWWQLQTPAPAPYITSNNNTFQIYQDINDTFITASDRLHLQAGDIVFDGNLTLSNIQVPNIDVNTLQANLGYISTLSSTTINASNIIANPLTGGLNTYYFKSTISYNNPPTSVVPLELTFNNDSPDYLPQYPLLPPFIGNNYFTSYNVSSWNNTAWNNSIAASLGPPNVFLGDLQDPLGTYAGTFYINNTIIVSGAYPIPIYYINSAGSNFLGNVNGGTWGKITTTNGTSWTLTTVTNPQGVTKSSYSNILTVTQDTQQTSLVDTQNLYIQTPNTTLATGTFGIYADQIRVNSHKYGFLESTGLNSYPIGIENTVYVDANIAWTNVPLGSGFWQSDATNAVYNITGDIYYDANSWIIQVIPSRFRTNNCPILSWDVQPTILSVSGGGWCWGFNRYIQVNGDAPGPGSGANNWNWILAIPKNYCSYI